MPIWFLRFKRFLYTFLMPRMISFFSSSREMLADSIDASDALILDFLSPQSHSGIVRDRDTSSLSVGFA